MWWWVTPLTNSCQNTRWYSPWCCSLSAVLHWYCSGSNEVSESLCCLLVDGFCALKPFTCAAIKNVISSSVGGAGIYDFLFSSAKTDRSFKEFLDARNPTKQHSTTLESYLIKPVQRVLKYPLLLRELVSLTDTDSEEHYHLTGRHTQHSLTYWCLVVENWKKDIFTKSPSSPFTYYKSLLWPERRGFKKKIIALCKKVWITWG